MLGISMAISSAISSTFLNLIKINFFTQVKKINTTVQYQNKVYLRIRKINCIDFIFFNQIKKQNTNRISCMIRSFQYFLNKKFNKLNILTRINRFKFFTIF